MSRGWTVYILMFAMFGVGLWAVLRVGSALEAPAEIAGTWKVRWESDSPTSGPEEGTLTVDQSGRFCTFHFDDEHGRSFSMKMVEGSALGHEKPGRPWARLEGDGYRMTLHSTAVQDTLRLEIAGREQYRGLIDRISRPADRAESDSDSSPKPAPVADARP